MFGFCFFNFIFDAGIKWWWLLRVDCCVSGAVGDVLDEGRSNLWQKMFFYDVIVCRGGMIQTCLLFLFHFHKAGIK